MKKPNRMSRDEVLRYFNVYMELCTHIGSAWYEAAFEDRISVNDEFEDFKKALRLKLKKRIPLMYSPYRTRIGKTYIAITIPQFKKAMRYNFCITLLEKTAEDDKVFSCDTWTSTGLFDLNTEEVRDVQRMMKETV